MTHVRNDIQALRGLAVSLVVLEHIGATWFKNGFLGVDIFFVISGFLITGIIAKQITAGKFSFTEFYLRRAKRLLPAAYVTILLTAIGSAYFLNSVEATTVTSQVIGALTFSINFVLWQQVGYFDVAAASKPLLHMWSLAIEEQFYILFPAILVFTPRRAWRFALATLAVVSLIACIYIAQNHPSAAFYLLPTRAWELMIGAIAALLAANQATIRIARALLIPSFAALAILPFVSTGHQHPGADAAIVCLATACILLGRSAIFERVTPKTGLVQIGNVSYSLYLVHWPIIVFMNNAYIDEIPITARVVAVALALALAYAMFRTVEEPFRSGKVAPWAAVTAFPAAAAIVIAVQFAMPSLTTPEVDFAKLREINLGLGIDCASRGDYEDKGACRTSEAPSSIVWGDSYAMHSVPGLAKGLGIDLRQATMNACAPLPGAAPYVENGNNREQRAITCLDFNQSVLEFIIEHREIQRVFVAANFLHYVSPNNKLMVRNGDGSVSMEAAGLAIAKTKLRDLRDSIAAAGRELILIAPPPRISNQILFCMERTLANKIAFGSNAGCSHDVADYHKNYATELSLIDYAEKDLMISVVRIDAALCNSDSCETILEGTPIYRDNGHLSYAGSEKVFSRISI